MPGQYKYLARNSSTFQIRTQGPRLTILKHNWSGALPAASPRVEHAIVLNVKKDKKSPSASAQAGSEGQKFRLLLVNEITLQLRTTHKSEHNFD